METVLFPIAEVLDQVRAAVLRTTLTVPAFRGIFVSRAKRLMTLFALAWIFQLGAALLFPLWVLVIGPMIFGFPHLIASIRYLHPSLSGTSGEPAATRARSHTYFLAVAAFALISGLRLYTDLHAEQSVQGGAFTMGPELLGLGAVFAGCAWIYRKTAAQVALGSLALAPLLFAAWNAPLWTTGFLLLGHNFIGFFYWFRSAKSRSERRVVLVSSLLFGIGHVLIFSGWLDGIYRLYTPAAQIRAANLDYAELGRAIHPGSSSYVTWFHGVVAYAFGQAMHYFVWLKAIPDQHLSSEAPSSFKQSLRLLNRELGTSLMVASCVLVACGLGVWCLTNLAQARAIYFAVASFHGYLEIAGLALMMTSGRTVITRASLVKAQA